MSTDEDVSSGSNEKNHSYFEPSKGDGSNSSVGLHDEDNNEQEEEFTTQLSIKKWKAFVKGLSREQISDVWSCGFGHTLKIGMEQTPRKAARYVAMHFDPNTKIVSFGDARSFRITTKVVHDVLGVPTGGPAVPKKIEKHDKQTIYAEFGASDVAPTIDDLIKLVNKKLKGPKFIRIYVMIVLSLFMCPTSHNRISPQLMAAIVDVKNIKNLDWCSFVLDWLCKKVQQYKLALEKAKRNKSDKKLTLGGCLPVLAVAYFEHLHAPEVQVADDLPRIKVWNDKAIRHIEKLDSAGDFCSFGHLPFKSPTNNPFELKVPSGLIPEEIPADVEECICRTLPQEKHEELRLKLKKMCKSYYKRNLETCFNAMHPCLVSQMCEMVTLVAGELVGAEAVDGSQQDVDVQFSLHNTPVPSPISPAEYGEFAGRNSHGERSPEDSAGRGGDGGSRIQIATPSSTHRVDAHTRDKITETGASGSSRVLRSQRKRPYEASPYEASPDVVVQPSPEARLGDQVVVPLSNLVPAQEEAAAVASQSSLVLRSQRKRPSEASPDVLLQPEVDELLGDQMVVGPSILVAAQEEAAGDLANVGKKKAGRNVKAKAVQAVHDGCSKRTIKKARVLSSPSYQVEPWAKKIVPTKFEKDLYLLATRRPPPTESKACMVGVGGLYAERHHFYEAMKGTGWMHTSVMDVFLKQLMADQNSNPQPNCRKLFVNYFVAEKIFRGESVKRMKKYFMTHRIGLEFEKTDMVFIPFCNDSHWWLIVINLRDTRFDIMSSLKIKKQEVETSKKICKSFKYIYEHVLGDNPKLDLDTFQVEVHKTPQQHTPHDCGIYVQAYIDTWNGRQVHDILQGDVHTLRQKYTAYMLTHRANEQIAPFIQEFISSNKKQH